MVKLSGWGHSSNIYLECQGFCIILYDEIMTLWALLCTSIHGFCRLPVLLVQQFLCTVRSQGKICHNTTGHFTIPLYSVWNNTKKYILPTKGFEVHFQWSKQKSNLPSCFTRIQGIHRYASFKEYFKFKQRNASVCKIFLDFSMALSMTEETNKVLAC